jgi:hypothetical protein
MRLKLRRLSGCADVGVFWLLKKADLAHPTYLQVRTGFVAV